MRWRLDLEYDGAPFAGSQLQSNAPTVQEAVETALAALLGVRPRIHAAGRTDTGVHALQQVVVFDTEVARTEGQLRDGLNAHLPRSVAVVAAVRVADGWDPRRAPHVKVYRYTWLDRPSRSPLLGAVAWHVRDRLAVGAMQTAVEALVGTHDLQTFRATGCTATTTVRTVQAARIWRDGDLVHLEVEGTGFLRHTVRILAGTLALVGHGRRPTDAVRTALLARDRAAAGPTAPARGLVLRSIAYLPAGDADPVD
jgi:tRNA pseudouridine38-40 synthase